MTATETGAIDETPAGPTPPGLTPAQRLKAILGGSAGNLVEWYDWSAYIFFTVYFASHFFPEGDQTAQLFKAAAVSAVGFLARPLGAWLMGMYADRAGRRAAPLAPRRHVARHPDRPRRVGRTHVLRLDGAGCLDPGLGVPPLHRRRRDARTGLVDPADDPGAVDELDACTPP